MSLLRDSELVALVSSEPPIISQVKEPRNWYSDDSPVQPSSIDLCIGNIFLPDDKKAEKSGNLNDLSDHCLQPGGTVVITTLENVRLPSDLAGIVFPASAVSFKGILMTNPGHIDPGFEGKLRFTIINMGKEHFGLKRGEVIATMLLLRLAHPAQANWIQRCGAPASLPSLSKVNKLSHDFLDVDNRAQKTVNDALIKGTLILTVLGIIGGAVIQYIEKKGETELEKNLNDLKSEVAILKAAADYKKIETRIESVESALTNAVKNVNIVSKMTDAMPEAAKVSPGLTPDVIGASSSSATNANKK